VSTLPSIFSATRPSTKKQIGKNDIHVCLDHLLVRLGEDEVRDQDVKERLHFDQREALTYAGLQREIASVGRSPTAHVRGWERKKKRTRGPAENDKVLE
jgi:hypothetical protein